MFQSKIVGIDIGSHGIKMAEVAPSRRSFEISAFGVNRLPQNAIAVREIIDYHAVVEGIRDLARSAGIKSRSAVLSLAGPGTFVKRVQLQGVKESDLPSVIAWEAAQWIPFPIEEVQLDYEVVGVDRFGGFVDVVLVAAKKELIQNYIGVVKEAGFIPTAFDVDAFALQNIFETNYHADRPQLIGILSMGESITSINLIQNGSNIFSRDLLLGGEKLTSGIQERLKLDYNEAESLKIGASSGATVPEVLDEIQTFVGELASTISGTIHSFYQESPTTDPLGSLYLAGGGAQVPGIVDRIGDELQVHTEVMSPVRRIDLKKGLSDSLNSVAPVAALSIGLAARRGLKRAKH